MQFLPITGMLLLILGGLIRIIKEGVEKCGSASSYPFYLDFGGLLLTIGLILIYLYLRKKIEAKPWKEIALTFFVVIILFAALLAVTDFIIHPLC